MSFRIRTLKDTDALAVCELSRQLGYPLDSGQFLGRLLMLRENPNHSLWVMEAAEKGVCAFAHFERVVGMVHVPRLDVNALIIDERFRRKGLAKRFMLYAESYARTEDLTQVYLTCNIARTETHDFYDAMGYQKVKTSFSFLKILS